MVSNTTLNGNSEFSQVKAIPNADVATFIRFLRQIKLERLLSKVPDSREQSKISYSNYSLLLWALSVFFRQESKNSLYTTIENIQPEKRTSLFSYMGIQGEAFPHPSVVDDYLSTVDPEEINKLLVELFINCQKNKVFYNHSETLLPNNSFHIGVDGFWVHHYHKPHAVDDAGYNICPYCLPRVHNKGTPQEKTTWIHVFVTFVMIFPGGLTLPIYVYPLKSRQVNTSKHDDDLKQECELIAAHAVLPIIRKLFPRLQITFLGDSLYANQPFISLCISLCIDFLIVRKEKSLPAVGKKCDELAGLFD